jgi:hypothetical protein
MADEEWELRGMGLAGGERKSAQRVIRVLREEAARGGRLSDLFQRMSDSLLSRFFASLEEGEGR